MVFLSNIRLIWLIRLIRAIAVISVIRVRVVRCLGLEWLLEVIYGYQSKISKAKLVESN